jgi:hypothetical protein
MTEIQNLRLSRDSCLHDAKRALVPTRIFFYSRPQHLELSRHSTTNTTTIALVTINIIRLVDTNSYLENIGTQIESNQNLGQEKRQGGLGLQNWKLSKDTTYDLFTF